jgi:tRNA-binding EMAP/Myf-like protein
MAACTVKRVTDVGPHPREDRDDLNVLHTQDGLQFVSQKIDRTVQRYQPGDLVVHIPHGAILPPALQERLGAREAKIKAGNFAGVRSEGMLMALSEVRPGALEGDDVTSELGISF